MFSTFRKRSLKIGEVATSVNQKEDEFGAAVLALRRCDDRHFRKSSFYDYLISLSFPSSIITATID